MRILVVLSFAALAACGNLVPKEETALPGEAAKDAAADTAAGFAADDLMGSWSCSQTTKEGSGTEEISYASGGRVSAQLEMTLKVEGNEVALSGTGAGTWELKDDQLTEELTKFTILGATVNKAPVTDRALLDKFEESMENQIVTSTIKSLDEESLFVISGDNKTTCTRN